MPHSLYSRLLGADEDCKFYGSPWFSDHVLNRLQKEVSIQYYQGPLYKGSCSPPDRVFVEGMNRLQSPNLRDYVIFVQDLGVSTSKRYSIARYYAARKLEVKDETYIYFINYRGARGIDINASRSSFFYSIYERAKNAVGQIDLHEVKIAERLSPYYIEKCQVIRRDRIIEYANPRFLRG